jgi:hypothetical protein
MPSPCANAGTMYLFSVEEEEAAVMSVEHEAAVDGQ